MDDQAKPSSFGDDLQSSDAASALKQEQEDHPMSSEKISISGPKNERPRIGESMTKVVQPGHGRGLEIRVVDETALIGSVFSFLDEKKKRKKKKKEKEKMVYSRETMESARFVNVKEQAEMWKDVHVGLGPTVRKEYDFLLPCTASSDHHHHQQASASLSHSGSFAPRGRLNQVKVSQ